MKLRGAILADEIVWDDVSTMRVRPSRSEEGKMKFEEIEEVRLLRQRSDGVGWMTVRPVHSWWELNVEFAVSISPGGFFIGEITPEIPIE